MCLLKVDKDIGTTTLEFSSGSEDSVVLQGQKDGVFERASSYLLLWVCCTTSKSCVNKATQKVFNNWVNTELLVCSSL